MERWGYHYHKKKRSGAKPPYYTLRQRLISSLLASWSLLLTASVHVASLAMQPRLVELWKCRVQHLRRYSSDQKHKQMGHSITSPGVWYLPVFMMSWLIVISCLVLLALSLKITYKMDSGMFVDPYLCTVLIYTTTYQHTIITILSRC